LLFLVEGRAHLFVAQASTLIIQGLQGLQGLQGEKRPQSRRLTASLFIKTHKIMKEKRKFVVILIQKNQNIF